MKAPGRHLKIRALLDEHEFVDLETFCRELDASESSVRRDLVQLESEGLLRRVYGGAMAPREQNDGELTREQGLDFDSQSIRQAEEKRLIAAKTADLIEDRQTI